MFARLTEKSDPHEHAKLRRAASRNIALANSNAESPRALRPLVVQTKLSVSQPNDHYEREADHVADAVMETSAPSLSVASRRHDSNANHFSFSSVSPDSIQRKCDSCEEEEGLLQRKAKDNGHNSHTPATSIVHDVLQSPGQPLNSATLGFMESRMGHDFSRVRVHSDSLAAAAANALNARAFTVGRNIGFAAGAFAPESQEGRRLIAHELAHVAQQSRGVIDSQVISRKGALSSRTTQEHIDDSVTADVDAAIAESATIAKFLAKKSLKKTKGNLSVEQKEVYASLYADYKKKYPGSPDVKDVPGFTDRDKGKITLRLNDATVEAALHEGIHLNSKAQFQGAYGHPCNEGITQYFTNAVLVEQTLDKGKAYPDELKLAEDIIAIFGEGPIGKAYFLGDMTAYGSLVSKLSGPKGDFSRWRDLMNSEKVADWKAAVALLKTYFP